MEKSTNKQIKQATNKFLLLKEKAWRVFFLMKVITEHNLLKKMKGKMGT